jgi:hypothetical protein
VSTPLLAVFVDGTPLPEPEARAFWARFSAHMDQHKGDLAGFALAEGLASVHPESRRGQAVLVASRSSAQRAYGSEPERGRAPPGKKRR